jgi:hypothetical protein
MAEKWSLKGENIATCICNTPCPCLFGQDPTHGRCGALNVFSIAKGTYGSVDLSGRKFALVVSWQGNVFAGNLTVGFYVDDGTTDDQMRAFETILTGKAGGAFGNLAALYGTVKGIKRMPIEVGDGQKPVVAVAKTSVPVEYTVGGDQQSPVVVTNSPFDFGGAGLRIGKTQARFVDEEWGFDFQLVDAYTGAVDLAS